MTTAVSRPEPALDNGHPKAGTPTPLRAVHTLNFPALLRQLGTSLLATTYQAGKLVMVREEGNYFLRSGQVVALLRFETAVQEVFAVTVLSGRRFPDLKSDGRTLLENSFEVPEAALADVSAAPRAPAASIPRAAGTGGNGSAPR